MGSTPKTVTHFEDWLRRQLLKKRWRIADLAREIARQEGIAEDDDEDFRRRAKSIQNNFSNVFNGISNLGFEYATKVMATEWDRVAQTIIDDFTEQYDTTIKEIARLNGVIDNLERQHKAKPFLSRLLDGKGDSEIKKQILALTEKASVLDKMGDDLGEKIDLTPNSSEERNEMVAELKQLKKELQLEKRETKAAMRDIRSEARTASVKASYWAYSRKYSASQRRSIRYQAERKLGPHEDAVQAIDRQINSIDRRLMWLERYR